MLITILSLVLSNWRVFLVGGALVVGGIWLLHERETLIAQGVQREKQAVEQANAQAKSAADKAQAQVDACFARGSGFTWDRATGVCHGPTR